MTFFPLGFPIPLPAVNLFSQTTALIRREILLEQRQKYALYGVLLYVISTIFVSKFSFMGMLDIHSVQDADVPMIARAAREVKLVTWNALFWVILLFAAVTGVARSFAQESRGRLLYLYTLADPRALLLAKLVYNILLMTVLGFAGLLVYAFLVGYPVLNTTLFLVTLFLGCMGLASAFTMISAIASKAGNNFTLMAILGFPVVLPMLLATMKLSRMAVSGISWDEGLTYLGVLGALNLITITLTYLLFPYLWRD
jgi:heme exporter protein B